MLQTDDCHDCTPSHLQRRLDAVPLATIAFSSVPLIATWLIVSFLASQRLFPLLSAEAAGGRNVDREGPAGLPVYKDASKGATTTSSSTHNRRSRPTTQTLARLVFSVSIGLSAVLAELLLCEISNTLHPAARGLAVRITLASLLALSVLVTPALEIHGFAATILEPPTDLASTKRTNARARLALEVILFASWLTVFWYIPRASILRHSLHTTDDAAAATTVHGDRLFTQTCLERVGIIGISIMASLSGFAAVSSLWQTFGVRHRPVRDSDISRKAAGLAATEDMLAAKQSRLRALQHKMADSATTESSKGFVGRVVGTFRGGADVNEHRALLMELSGLDTMRFALAQSLATLRARHAEQRLARTPLGRLLRVSNSAFAVYCAYRIGATSLSSLRRWWQPGAAFATADPINNLLALATTHWDGDLDRAAWSRQISFLLSGFILLASFSAVLQTFRLFSRFAPAMLQRAHTSLPLLISQVAGTYVISSALLLRSNLPAEVGGVITEALGAPLEGSFVEAWFESWFLVAVGLTATGILVGRKVGGGSDDDDWDDHDGMEMGKRH